MHTVDVGFFERCSVPLVSPFRRGWAAKWEGRTMMRTNKSYYPPQGPLDARNQPLELSGDARLFLEEPRKNEGCLKTSTTYPYYAVYTNSLKGFPPSVLHPSGIFFRYKRRRATRFEQRPRNFGVLWMGKKVGQENVTRHLGFHHSFRWDELFVQTLQMLTSDKFLTERNNRRTYDSPLPLLPTNLRSLNLATWFFIKAVEFLSSAQQFSSLPARTVTKVPSPTSPRATTLKATGRVLLDLQCAGRTVQTKCGEPITKMFIWSH